MLLILSLALAQPSPPIVNGYETSGIPAVGSIVAMKGNNGGSICSGTLVKIWWVLTAAHCVDAAQQYQAQGWDIHFVVGGSIYEPWDASSAVASMVQHPDYVYDANGVDYDLGLLKLSEPIKTVGLMRLNTDTVVSTWKGLDLTYVGYGITDTGNTDAGVKRAVVMPLWEYDGQFVYTIDDEAPVKNICSGDSGGAALMRREQDDLWEIIGVNSFVWNNNGSTTIDCGNPGTGGAASRVDRNVDWLREYFDVEEEVHEGDADADSDSDTDTDADSDSDTDTDVPDDTGLVDSGLEGTPTDKGPGNTGLCAPLPAGPAGAWAALIGLVALARRRNQ